MIIRTYHCDSCDQEFEVTCNSSDPAPDCPLCSQVLEWTPGLFAITGTKSKAIDTTQQILEQDFGLSNFNDNMREGDVAAKTVPDKTGVQRDAEIRQISEVAQAVGQPMTEQQHAMAQNFWGGGAVAQSLPVAQLISNAKASTAAANAEGVNPMALLHKAGKEGRLKTPINVVARAKA